MNQPKLKIAIIGGGAAGFFAAFSAKKHHPDADVVIFEKSSKTLSKVKISGGGRCNVTNSCSDIKELIKAYPRGEKKLRSVFSEFNTTDTVEWFESRGVPLVTQEDHCIFPKSQNSQSIIDCFYNEIKRLSIDIKLSYGIDKIQPLNQSFQLISSRNNETFIVNKVIITTGGGTKLDSFNWLKEMDISIVPPVPSLFTFNMPKESITELMGIVVENAFVQIQGTKIKCNGPLLITHWGMSGPSILKASAYGARVLADSNYNFSINVNWINGRNESETRLEIEKLIKEHALKNIGNIRPFFIPERLWHFLLSKCTINLTTKWSQLGNKNINKIVHHLTNDNYQVEGKTTFKEEFVTAGGIDLNDVDMKTMQSKKIQGLYFAGEVLDIDGITGGFNFQAAWSTGFIAGQLKNNYGK